MVKKAAIWVVHAIALTLVGRIIPGISVSSFSAALIAVLVISFVNIIIKPILILVTLPITILTLGLFTFIINAVLFILVGSLTPGFQVSGFGAALLGSLVYSVISTMLLSLVR